MSADVGFTNGFRALAALRKAAEHEGLAEIEGNGMDPGRVFLHAAPGWFIGDDYGTHSYSVGTAHELKFAMTTLRRTAETVTRVY